MNPLPQAQLTRYRELYKILTDTVPGADSDYSQMPYDELCEWCVGEMEPVFRWLVIATKYFLVFIKYFLQRPRRDVRADRALRPHAGQPEPEVGRRRHVRRDNPSRLQVGQ